MKERPILFSGEMVRAILDGRKTQTRRLVKPDPDATWGYLAGDDADGPPALEWAHVTDGSLGHSGSGWYSTLSEYPDEGSFHFRCPYGAPGDRLWVRETWALAHLSVDCEGVCDDVEEFTGRLIAANRDGYWAPIYAADADDINNHPSDRLVKRYRPSIHMPRWASRLMLEVVSVRVERLQDITEADALAEGVDSTAPWFPPGRWSPPDEDPRQVGYGRGNFALQNFRALWEHINGKRAPWGSNSWVWVVTFKPL